MTTSAKPRADVVVAERWSEERTVHGVGIRRHGAGGGLRRAPLPCTGRLAAGPRVFTVAMPQRERDAKRAACIAGRRLDPHFLERPFAEDPAVADAVQSDAAGQ